MNLLKETIFFPFDVIVIHKAVEIYLLFNCQINSLLIQYLFSIRQLRANQELLTEGRLQVVVVLLSMNEIFFNRLIH